MDYNPHAPQLIGNEWTPIQQADLRTPSTIEQGYQFRISTVPVTVQMGTFSPAETRYAPNTAQMVYLYPTGTPPTDAASGPVQTTLVAPDGWTTVAGTITVVGAANVAAALAQPLDGSYVNFAEAVGNTALDLDVFFTVPASLSGRRILSVDVEYAAISSAASQNVPGSQYTGLCLLRPTSTAYVCWVAQKFPTAGPQVLTGLIGETNSFWRPAAVAGNPDNPEIMPWTYEQLQRFASGTSTTIRQAIRAVVRASAAQNQSVQLHYLALKVTHCAERRVLFGGWRVQKAADGYTAGSRAITSMYNPSLGLGVLISVADNYTVTSTNVYSPPAVPLTQFGDELMRPSNPPLIRALRQLEKVPGVPPLPDVVAGVTFGRPTQPGKIFTRSESQVIPQLTVHSSTAIVTGAHAYGVQVAAPVQASPVRSAIQGVLTGGKAAGGSYGHVTFYARLVDDVGADPTNQLQITINIGGTDVAQTSITIAQFKELSPIVDGWCRVQLPIGPVAIFNTDVATVTWHTPYVGVWEILGADGPSQLSPHGFGTASYGFAGKALDWVRPDGTSGVDPLADASFVLSLVVPPVTGLAATEQQFVPLFVASCQVCADTRCCTVQSISFVRLTWNASAIGTGFKEYRIYRTDPIGPLAGGPVLIGVITDQGTTTFDDFEFLDASSVTYHVTVVDMAGVESPDATVEITLTPGGVTLSNSACADSGSVLIFTSNHDPQWTCAYPKVTDRGRPVDEFVYPEADTVDLERMYGRDCQVAFRPVERGCEAFTCDLLVYESCDPELDFNAMHQAMIPLRNIAWADVPYVTVRDSDGGRWFASVTVPGSSLYRDRGAVMARSVQVVEVVQQAGPVGGVS